MQLLSNAVERYRKIPVPAKASLWFIFSSLVQRGIAFITVPIFTRIMTPEQYGLYSTYAAWYGVMIVFTSLNLYYGVFNNAMVKFEDNRDRYISSMQGLTIVITMSFFLVYLVFRDTLNSFLGMTTPLAILLFAELLVTPAMQFWLVHNRFNYRYKTIVVVSLVKAVLNPVLGIILVLITTQKDVARIVSTVMVELLICVPIVLLQFKKGKCFFDKQFWKYSVLFNIPLLPHYLSGSILNQGDRIMISKMVGDSQVAFYNVAYNIGLLMNLFTGALNSAFVPWIYNKMKERKTSDIQGTTNALLLLMALLVSGLMFFAPELLSIMAPVEYADALYIIPPVAVSVFFIFMYNIFSNIEFYFETRKYVAVGSIIAAVVNIVLNYIFIPVYGYYAAGYTTLICYIIYGLSHLYFAKKVCKKNTGKSDVFSTKVTVLLSAYLVILMVLLNYIYKYIFVRYLLIAFLLVGLIVKRKSIISLVANLGRNKQVR